MNRQKLKQEGRIWVEEGIISQEQYDQILNRYVHKDPNFIINLFAILLTGLGFLTFIMTEWARQPHISRVIIFTVITIAFLVWGHILYRKRPDMLAVSFIVLGYIVFGAGMLLTITIYQVQIDSAWPFIIWAIAGLGLYFIYKHKLLFTIAIAVTTIGQLYSVSQTGSFDWILLLILLLGFGHFAYHHANYLFSYLCSISFSIQMLILAIAEEQQYYWLIVYYLVLYLAGDLVPKQVFQKPFKLISLLSIFIMSMYQTFMLQEDFFMNKVEFQWSFAIVWIVLFVIAVLLKLIQHRKYELMDLLLFLPIVFLPFSYILSLTILFIFSLGWLFLGYRQDNNEYILLGTTAFLFSTFTVFIQFAWDAINKSLFFMIGGILLFLISFSVDRQRRAIAVKHKEGEK
ncbi:DUF2157 domain-containing protein [Oceanobacillus massiliensis]|uniref:DUF2157 domain-containing protein n=1 Tax=Oceanobacillus massiliensis TaxID=1465765 RepID=UPI000288CA67|nr:DUF2157 domain-containing protein [Oceanobacillus massiliensis]